jgi:methylenetetrahydrofolate dehydrogenase (NADP+)/methenyltetrahydrofolate cyclohydrolase
MDHTLNEEKGMTAQLLDGRATSATIREEITAQVAEFKAKAGFVPNLAVVQLGSDRAATSYVGRIQKSCDGVGMGCTVHALPLDVSQDDLLALIRSLNGDKTVHGIIIQEPLPDQINPEATALTIDPNKDVDGASPINAGLLFQNLGHPFVPPTPGGGMELLTRYGVTLKGARAVVIGRSNIVGRPMAMLLEHQHATVTICHSRTVNLAGVAREADILVCAIGRAKMVTADFVKAGAVVVDFGVNFVDGAMCGDTDFTAVSEVASLITPVPGGTGPMTNVLLLRNTLEAAHRAVGG